MTMKQESTEIAIKTSMAELVGYRDRALQRAEAVMREIEELNKLAAKVSPVVPWAAPKLSLDRNYPTLQAYRKQLDAAGWRHLMEATEFRDVMSAKQKKEWQASLDKEPPEFTMENAIATFGNLVENIGNIFVQSIADAFERLPRSFKSHDGFKIGARCILDAAVDPRYNGRFSWRSYRHSNARDTLDDLDRAFHRLAKLEWKTHAGDIADKAMSEGESDCETTFFRLRFFANGNVHVWMKNADIVKEANKLLAEHYGPKLGHMHKPPHQRP